MSRLICEERLTLYDKVEEKLENNISTVLDYASFILKVTRLLMITDEEIFPDENIKEKLSRPFFRLRNGEDGNLRLYIYLSKNKYFSINYPFFLKRKRDDNIMINTGGEKHISVSSKILSESISCITEMMDDHVTFTEMVQNRDYEDDVFNIIEILLTTEPGYIRYDEDIKNFNTKNHPVFHFDINFSDEAHFKIGLNKRYGIKSFENIFDKKRKRPYCTNRKSENLHNFRKRK